MLSCIDDYLASRLDELLPWKWYCISTRETADA